MFQILRIRLKTTYTLVLHTHGSIRCSLNALIYAGDAEMRLALYSSMSFGPVAPSATSGLMFDALHKKFTE